MMTVGAQALYAKILEYNRGLFGSGLNIITDEYLVGFNFSSVSFFDITIIDCDLSYANFNNAEFSHVDIENCCLVGTSFRGAAMYDVNIDKCLHYGDTLYQPKTKNKVSVCLPFLEWKPSTFLEVSKQGRKTNISPNYSRGGQYT